MPSAEPAQRGGAERRMQMPDRIVCYIFNKGHYTAAKKMKSLFTAITFIATNQPLVLLSGSSVYGRGKLVSLRPIDN